MKYKIFVYEGDNNPVLVFESDSPIEAGKFKLKYEYHFPDAEVKGWKLV